MSKYSLGYFIPLKMESHYFYYDTNSNNIIRVPELYKELLNEYVTKGEIPSTNETDNNEFKSWLKELVEKGVFQKNPIKEIKHPLYDVCGSYIKNNVKSLLLQVTQQCNLLCRYCGYSSLGVLDRQHNNSYMSFDVAKKAIDFVFANAKTNDYLTISFYGGEPCANFSLIQECVTYIQNQYYGCARYNMTTNFTMVNDRMLEFFIQNEFDLTISIDGPEEITNAMRRYKHNGRGVFATVYNNLRILFEMSPEYYKKHVAYNAVIDPKYDYNKIVDFFADDELLKHNPVNFDLIDDSKNDYVLEYADEYIKSFNETMYKECLAELLYHQSVHRSHPSKVSDGIFERNIAVSTKLPSYFHHAGPCVAGCSRLFVDVKGNYFPCEKAAGVSAALMIGDVEKGLDVEKVRACLNIGTLTETQCKNCWANRFCSICAVQCDDISDSKLSGEVKRQYCITQREKTVKNLRKVIIKNECKRILAQM